MGGDLREAIRERVEAARAAVRALPPELPRSDEERRELEGLLNRLRALDARLSAGGFIGWEQVGEAESVREGLVRLGRRDAAPPVAPARLELLWSETARVARRPLLTRPEP